MFHVSLINILLRFSAALLSVIMILNMISELNLALAMSWYYAGDFSAIIKITVKFAGMIFVWAF